MNSVVTNRDKEIIRAELIDALQDYADIFRQKAEMEIERAVAVDEVRVRILAGVPLAESDMSMMEVTGWFSRYRLLEMHFQELQIKVNRLILELGE